jgi:hypothetical protein
MLLQARCEIWPKPCNAHAANAVAELGHCSIFSEARQCATIAGQALKSQRKGPRRSKTFQSVTQSVTLSFDALFRNVWSYVVSILTLIDSENAKMPVKVLAEHLPVAPWGEQHFKCEAHTGRMYDGHAPRKVAYLMPSCWQCFRVSPGSTSCKCSMLHLIQDCCWNLVLQTVLQTPRGSLAGRQSFIFVQEHAMYMYIHMHMYIQLNICVYIFCGFAVTCAWSECELEVEYMVVLT